MDLVRYTGTEDWSALYVDGKLERVGDHYLVDERISQLLGVDERSSDAFMQGGNQREDVAKTLDAAEAYDDVINQKQKRAEELIAEANRLKQEAEKLIAEANK